MDKVGIKANTPGILFTVPIFKWNYEFHTYSLTLTMGILASILTIVIFWQREKYKWEYLMTLILLTIPFSLIGARLWDLVEEAQKPEFNMARDWYKIWEGGLSIQGGVVLASIVDFTYIYSKRNELDIRKVASIIIPTILIGQVIGRWGNYANHELYGKVDWDGSSVTWLGDKIADNMFIADKISESWGEPGLYRYPLFLYEGIANLIGYLILVWIINNFGLLKPGGTGALYFVWYGTVRAAMEPLRETSYQMYTIASYIFVAIGALAFIYLQFFSKVHYVREWRKWRYVYDYAHPEEYKAYVEKTKFSIFKKSKNKDLIVSK
ncbi:prolipoprotein diacylglyceryl transferase [Mycoplasma sp. Mirounga ES2805-ORL]|uniref:prolipoprotein diacylglyceryl transferase n=1 Tax=Mycoplasma sp. Mirounga ES2805-ORL TaxID=754514 RepID=UPI00197C1901|nr:prolipoprotein diacylglyceryl transferase [Mycoplasma sp. Mirounga ES2805-ORL]QSF13449.1 prolipoprotein diacylglyceryl transferase [Mycoplasma sp. Mirounga ES2805-ORL]